VPYVKGGAAWAEFDHDIATGAATIGAGVMGPTYAVSDNRVGHTVGAGIEYALGGNWSAKLEYDYMDFGTRNLALAPTSLGIFAPTAIAINVDDRERVQLIKAGLNYRFGWGGPVVARY
jgi:outer membrane immunogenic protein